MSRWQWILRQLTRRLWLRASLIGFLGVFAAIFAAVAERFLPWEMPFSIGADAVESILTIIASSMLAVTTFSLSVTTAAVSAATSNVTPRATKLLVEDRITQNVLSTFVGSFLFGIVGIIVLNTGAYGDRGRVVLFLVTVGVIALIVITLLRWIDHLTRLGRVGETTSRVEEATRQAIDDRLAAPFLGGHPFNGAEVAGATEIRAGSIGYLQHIDMDGLSACAKVLDADIYLPRTPGALLYADTVLAWIAGPADEAAQKAVREAFLIASARSFDQDPRFGLVVMSEIGLRAISPAVNDPGTAIDVIGRTTRLLARWSARPDQPPEIAHPRLHVVPLADADLFEDGFMLLARDGAGMIEVQLRLQKSLAALTRMGDASFQDAARQQSSLALARSDAALTLAADRTRLRQALPRA